MKRYNNPFTQTYRGIFIGIAIGLVFGVIVSYIFLHQHKKLNHDVENSEAKMQQLLMERLTQQEQKLDDVLAHLQQCPFSNNNNENNNEAPYYE